MNILVVEDDSITLRRLQYFLEKWGHHVLSARNGLEAIEIFLTHPVELVLTDWIMPEMDGLELVEQITKRDVDADYVYVILLTSKSDKADVVQALSVEGVNDYITKPFDPDELRARISVGERTVRLERTLREYSRGLEKIVRHQTALIRKTQEETVLRLLSALETRDDGTSGHIRRVGDISVLIAEAAGWPRDRTEDLRLAALMHDIGKISLPDHLVRKAGPLSAEEFESLKRHTDLGARIFSGSELPLLQMAGDVAMGHHERWDGSGYPRQLSGPDIPEAARIVALADVFDTLAHDHPSGRMAMSRESVVRTMEKGRGTHFDPDLFDRFVERIDDIMDVVNG